MPLISVIVPVYKVEPYLKRCIDSILNQTYTDFELILIDDGSPDNCPAICDEYAKKDPRVHVIHQDNGGLSAARNAGIDWAFANSDSEWITFIDSDDWVHQNYLEIFYNQLIRCNSKILMCSFEKVTSHVNDRIIIDVKSVLCKPEEVYINKRGISTIAWCKLYNKEVFANHRFPIGKLHEDVFLVHQLLFICDTITVIDIPLYYYFQNPESITQKKWNPKRLDEIIAHEEQLVFFKNSPYKEAYRLEIVSYIWVLSDQLRMIRQQGKKYMFIRLRVKFKLALALLKFHSIVSHKSYMWAYESAFPILIKFYWKYSNLIHR